VEALSFDMINVYDHNAACTGYMCIDFAITVFQGGKMTLCFTKIHGAQGMFKS
jgi:hypothetical protein